jgi:hypothetical protein
LNQPRLQNRSRLQVAKEDIAKYFNRLPGRVFKPSELDQILSEQRQFWRLAATTNTEKFIAFLKDDLDLSAVHFDFPARQETCFVWGKVSDLELMSQLKKGVYFSHYTAMSTHGLTLQKPTAVYLTSERAASPLQEKTLTQEAIDRVFANPPRITASVCTFKTYQVHLINGTHTRQLGVAQKDMTAEDGTKVRARVTDLERTLIDCAVRPAYAGGVFEVAKAFENAREKNVSINKLAATLSKLSFTYPFHQVIGYYLERAGYDAHKLDLLRDNPMEFDFYLSHNMGATRYVKDWRLQVPQGL